MSFERRRDIGFLLQLRKHPSYSMSDLSSAKQQYGVFEINRNSMEQHMSSATSSTLCLRSAFLNRFSISIS